MDPFFCSIKRIVLGTVILAAVCLFSASAQRLSGRITAEPDMVLANASISIPALHLRSVTNDRGMFEFAKLPPGIYTLEFYSIGYEKETRTIDFGSDDVTMNVVLHATPLEMPVVTVTAKPQPAEITNAAQPVDVLEGRDLDRGRGQSIMQSIEELPGVSTFSRGPLSMKPVIRGLTSQRVVVATNGMRHDSQQWDDEQSPEIDALDVDRIDVVRGPNSVLFGSDALGGVVNVLTRDPRTPETNGSALSGELLINTFSNTQQASGGLALLGSGGGVSYRGQFSARNAEDIMTPVGLLPNSGASEVNGGGSIGTTREWGSALLQYSHFGQEIHISPDPDAEPDAAPQQEISHDRIQASFGTPISSARLEVNGTWQRSERSEFEDEDQAEADSAQVKLRLSTLTLDARVQHAPVGPLHGTLGASVMSQKNETLGLEPLIPGFTQTNFAGYAYEECSGSLLSISAGLRFDSRRLEVDDNDDLGIQAQSRDYTAVTGTAGVVWHVAAPVSVALNVGRGWRSPIAEELFINGADEGSIRFKVGDAGLQPEESLNLDCSVRYASSRLNAEASVFHNRINRYIYLTPTTEIDSASGFTKYLQAQANATLVGSEVAVDAALTDNVILHGGCDIVIGRNEETDSWLPMIPANRIRLGMKFTEPVLANIHHPYIGVNARVVFDQERTDQFESRTGGYSLFDFALGGEVAAGSNVVRIDCSVDNILDKAYVDHLSRYKGFGLNPGRNLALKLSIPFEILR